MQSGKTSPQIPLKLALMGYGKMGKLVEQKAVARGHSIEAIFSKNSPTDERELGRCDLAIDFTTADTVLENVKKAAQQKKNIVIGTTGWESDLKAIKELAEKYQIGVLYSPNFAIGVHIFLKLVKEASRLLSMNGEYDVTGVELHHKQKADSPSGTARLLADTILQEWQSKKNVCYGNPEGKIAADCLQFSSVRSGHFPGTHSLYFDSLQDTITLQHEAKGRDGFAHGAVIAAEWLHTKQGFYTLEDIL